MVPLSFETVLVPLHLRSLQIPPRTSPTKYNAATYRKHVEIIHKSLLQPPRENKSKALKLYILTYNNLYVPTLYIIVFL